MPTHAKMHKMSLASDAMSTTIGSKAAKMMKKNKSSFILTYHQCTHALFKHAREEGFASGPP
jgi:hypothetical protein